MILTLDRVRKNDGEGMHRARPPGETIERMRRLMPMIGVSEMNEITHIDRVSIPCFATIRPSALLKVSRYHVTSGITAPQAKVTAMMAALERFASEYRGEPMACASYEEIGITRSVDPRDLFPPRPLEMGEKVHWTEGWDILNMEQAFVPSNAVFHPYDSLGMVKPLFPSDTLGLASGNTKEEAILHALCEVIGCDALSMAERGRIIKKTLSLEDRSKAKELLEKFTSAGIEIYLWLLEGRCGIPTVVAAADDPVSRDPLLLVVGAGTHPSPQVAATEALVKVARNRMIQLTGSVRVERDRLVEQIGYERMKRFNRAWFSVGDTINLGDVPDLSSEFIDDDVRVLVDRMGAHTDRIVLCDLSVHEVPVIRAVVPRFEVSYIHKDRVSRRGRE